MLLRNRRGLRGKNQLDLALDTGVSKRHVNIVAGGRSGPGRKTPIGIAEAPDTSLRKRNTCSRPPRDAPLHPDGARDAPDVQSVTDAPRRMLRQHEPCPAVVMDRDWTVGSWIVSVGPIAFRPRGAPPQRAATRIEPWPTDGPRTWPGTLALM